LTLKKQYSILPIQHSSSTYQQIHIEPFIAYALIFNSSSFIMKLVASKQHENLALSLDILYHCSFDDTYSYYRFRPYFLHQLYYTFPNNMYGLFGKTDVSTSINQIHEIFSISTSSFLLNDK